MSSFFFILFYVLLIQQIKSQYLSFKLDFQTEQVPLEESKEKIFSHYYEHELKTYLCLGNPKQCFNFKIITNVEI